MGRVLAYDQLNASTFATGVANLPAGSTLLKARLACYTWFASEVAPPVVQHAPPNTLLGIAWVAHGTAIPVVTSANWKTSTWYVAGPGEMTVMDRAFWLDEGQTPSKVFLEHVFATYIELDVPLFEAAAFDLGISMNFLGGGFYTAANVYLSYQFTAWFD